MKLALGGAGVPACAFWLLLAVQLVTVCWAWTYTEVVGERHYICSVLGETSSTDDACCESRTRSWMCRKCWQACPRHSDPMVELDKNFKQLFGQDNATNTIKAALYRHTFDKPIAFHFAGDNGVGKTFAARLLAESFLQSTNGRDKPLKGLLTLEGEYLESDQPDRISENRERINQQVIQQLNKCPHSIILFDEVEKVDARTVSVLEPFLDKTFVKYKDLTTSTDNAIFIFTSDFGHEGMTNDKSPEELERMVRENVNMYWQARKKMGDLMQNIVPFVPLDQHAISQIIQSRINGLVNIYGQREGLQHICYEKEIPMLLAKQVMIYYANMNARGVDLLLNPKLVDPLLKLLRENRKQNAGSILNALGARVNIDTVQNNQEENPLQLSFHLENIVSKDDRPNSPSFNWFSWLTSSLSKGHEHQAFSTDEL